MPEMSGLEACKLISLEQDSSYKVHHHAYQQGFHREQRGGLGPALASLHLPSPTAELKARIHTAYHFSWYERKQQSIADETAAGLLPGAYRAGGGP